MTVAALMARFEALLAAGKVKPESKLFMLPAPTDDHVANFGPFDVVEVAAVDMVGEDNPDTLTEVDGGPTPEAPDLLLFPE